MNLFSALCLELFMTDNHVSKPSTYYSILKITEYQNFNVLTSEAAVTHLVGPFAICVLDGRLTVEADVECCGSKVRRRYS